jgi:hypothetical protein
MGIGLVTTYLHRNQWVGLSIKELWNERYARVFNQHGPSFVILENIKREARLWVLAGAERLGKLLPGE